MTDSFDVSMSGIGAKATSDLAAGAAEVYHRLREAEKDSSSRSAEQISSLLYTAFLHLPFLPPPTKEDTAIKDVSLSNIAWRDPASAIAAMGAAMARQWSEAISQASENQQTSERSHIAETTDHYYRRLRHADHPSSMSGAHGVTATFVIGAAYVGAIGGPTGVDTPVGTNVISDSMQQVTPLMGLRDDMRAELGLIGATFMYGAVFQATLETIAKAENTQGRTITAEFAKNYSDRLVALCNDKDYNDYLSGLITHYLEGTEGASKEKISQWVTIAKLGMLFSGLALFYQAETGGQTGAEVVSLLSPSATPLAANDPRAPLFHLIRSYLGELSIAQRQAALANIIQFLDAHKDKSELTEPLTVLRGVFEGDETLEQRRDATPA